VSTLATLNVGYEIVTKTKIFLSRERQHGGCVRPTLGFRVDREKNEPPETLRGDRPKT